MAGPGGPLSEKDRLLAPLDLATVPASVALDWFLLFVHPLADAIKAVLNDAIRAGGDVVGVYALHEPRIIALEADSHHLMTDVWTSAGVVVGDTEFIHEIGGQSEADRCQKGCEPPGERDAGHDHPGSPDVG